MYWWKNSVAQMISYTITAEMNPCLNVVINECLNVFLAILQKFVKVEPHLFCAGLFNCHSCRNSDAAYFLSFSSCCKIYCLLSIEDIIHEGKKKESVYIDCV
jgi:hypothetical protein